MPSGISQTISIVVAMYNEEESLPQLFERLATLQSEKPSDWRLDFVLVNDGSSDRTMEVASRLKPAKWDVQILSHSVNEGFGAAIRTGFAAVRGEIVGCYRSPQRELLSIVMEGIVMEVKWSHTRRTESSQSGLH